MAEERADRKVELLMQSVKKTRKRRRLKEEDEEEDMTKVVVSHLFCRAYRTTLFNYKTDFNNHLTLIIQ